MRKGWVVGAVVRLIFIVLVAVLSFLFIFDPILENYSSNNCIIYQSEVISNLKSSIETAKETHGIISRGFDVAQCVECMWYNKHDGQLMVKYAVKTSLISPVYHQIVPYNVSVQFVNLGCNCNDCNDPSGCSNINEKKLYHFFVNETSVECTNCDDSTNPCGGATYSSCVSDRDCYRGYLCQSTDTAWDDEIKKGYSMDTIGNWIEFTDGPHWSSPACVKDYGMGCSNETECSIYSGNDIEIHLGCQNTRLSSEKSCCLPLICNSYTENNGVCDEEEPADLLSCDLDEDCNKFCGDTTCGYVYDQNLDEYFNCFLLPGEECKYDWQCGSTNKAITTDIPSGCSRRDMFTCLAAGCSWCGCEECEEITKDRTKCTCLPFVVDMNLCYVLKRGDTNKIWHKWVGCEGNITAIRLPTKCDSGECCINSGHSCRIGDKDFCEEKYCCSSDDIIKDERCCIPNGGTCSKDFQCCSTRCNSGVCGGCTLESADYSIDRHELPSNMKPGALVNISVWWRGGNILRTGIFKHNESGVWDVDEYSFTRDPEWFDTSIIIGYVKGNVCWKQEVLDYCGYLTDNMPLQCFDVT